MLTIHNTQKFQLTRVENVSNEINLLCVPTYLFNKLRKPMFNIMIKFRYHWQSGTTIKRVIRISTPIREPLSQMSDFYVKLK